MDQDLLPPERVDHKLDIPPPTTDLVAAYDAAMSSLVDLHSHILQALQAHQMQQEAQVDEKDAAVAREVGSPMASELVDFSHPQTEGVMITSPLKRSFSVAVAEDAKGTEGEQAPRQQELKELSAHHGVDLEEWKGPPSEDMAREDVIGRIVQHHMFDCCASLMIFVNSIFIAIETQWMATNVSEPVPVQVMNYFCSFFFLVELILRMVAYGLDFFTRPGSRGWNIFDLCLVLVSFVDVASAFFSRDPTVDVLQAVKILKMLRIARIFRVFRFSRELSLMALMIVDSMRSLMWAMLMLMLMIFVFAVWFTTNATFYLREFADTASPTWFEDLGNSTLKNVIDIQRNFGTLHATTYSLLRSMLGGINWGILCDMLLKMDTISPDRKSVV